MLLNIMKFKSPKCLMCRTAISQRRFFSETLEKKYTNEQKEKILEAVNADELSGYEISKVRLKKIAQWKSSNGKLKTISDVEMIEGFSERTATKLFDSILDVSPKKPVTVSYKIKGKILQPSLSEAVRQSCKTVLSVFISVNCVCWALIDKSNYELLKWHYYKLDCPDGKKLQITDIVDLSWKVTQQLPKADIYVMKAETTTLRAGGSDPNNPKVIAVNLQKSQMISMIVALINLRSHDFSMNNGDEASEQTFMQKVYFLRPTLPYRLFGTLVGNEKVATGQTVEMLLQSSSQQSSDNSHVYIPERLHHMFRGQNDLQKDMLGHCLFLGLTFMDLCIYKNMKSIAKLAKREDN